jgi:hypothetical protein
LRIRRNATAIFAKQNNKFVQGVVDKVIDLPEPESSRMLLPEYHPRPAGDSEWPNSGCPFGH